MRTLNVLIALFFALVCALILYLSFYQINISRQRVMREKFRSDLTIFKGTLQKQIGTDIEILRSFRGLFEASETVTEEEWYKFAHSLELKRHKGILWVGFVKNVEEAPKEKQALWSKGQAQKTCPILYFFPETYGELLGFDFCWDVRYETVLDKSTESGEAQLGPALQVDNSLDQPSWRTLALPVYKNQQLSGWVVAQIDFARMLREIDRQLDFKSLGVRVYVGEDKASRKLVYERGISGSAYFEESQRFECGGAYCFLEFVAGKGILQPLRFGLPVLFLLLLLFLGVLLLAFFLLRYSGARLLRQEPHFVQEVIIKSFPYAVIAADKQGIIHTFNSAAEKLLGYSAAEMIGKTPEVFHDPEEVKQRANELSTILQREVKPGFEVFVALAEMGYAEKRRWTYIKKNGERVEVQLCVTALRDPSGAVFGYFGVPIDFEQIKLWHY